MALKITRSDKSSGTEYIGGAALRFERGVARVTGWTLRPSVAAGLRRRGYSVTFDRKAPTPSPPPAPPSDEQRPQDDPSAGTPTGVASSTDDDQDDDTAPGDQPQ